MRKNRWVLSIFLPLIALVVVFMNTGIVQADPFARGRWYGYFNNRLETSGADLIPGGIYVGDVQSFLNFYWAKLYSANVQDRVSAEFTILTMLGYPAGTGWWVAREQFPEWERTVRWYNDNGRISWAAMYSYTFNTYYQRAAADVAWYIEPSTRDSIVFYNPNGTSYAIKKDCANPVGDMSSLQIPPPPPPPTVVSCGTLVPIASSEINTPVSLQGRVTWSGPPPPGATSGGSMTVTTSSGATIPIPVNASPSGATNTVIVAGTYTPPSPGRYVVRWTVNVNGVAPTPSATCGGSGTANDTFWALNHPYIDVQGGDVAAGASFATQNGASSVVCGAAPYNTRAGIVSWNNNGSPNYAGAGTQYGAVAMNYIQSFITNRGNVGTGGKLAFANRTPPAGTYGGRFGDAPCVDYWNPKPVLSSLPQVGASINLNGMNGTYARTGNLTIGNSLIQDSRRLTLYVVGDVNITGNISYQNNGASWTSLAQIPNFKLIVHGRIFINAGINQMDGTYVAVPDNNYTGPGATLNTFANPQRGTISTCSSGFSSHSPATIAANPAPCSSTLTVNGSLAANQIFFLRSNGSVVTGQPSEIINYNPEVWLAPSGNATINPFYQSITGLPPVL